MSQEHCSTVCLVTCRPRCIWGRRTSAATTGRERLPSASQENAPQEGTPTTEVGVSTTLNMSEMATLLNLEETLQKHHQKYMAGVRKELATLLSQRLSASVSDVQGVKQDIKTLMDELKEVRASVTLELAEIRSSMATPPQQEIRDAIALQASLKTLN